MGVVRTKLYVEGMTCAACEERIKKIMTSLDGVSDVTVRLKGGAVEFSYDDQQINVQSAKNAIEKIGYAIRETKHSGTFSMIGIGILLAAAYLLASSGGLFQTLPKIDASIGYMMLFTVGILTSIHCVAMCGGIALSQSVTDCRSKLPPDGEGRLMRLLPGLQYNAGRVFSYTILGGLIGALGNVFNFSVTVGAAISAIAGLFMVLLGLKMIGVLEKLPLKLFQIPRPLRTVFSRLTPSLRKRGPFTVGVLNGFMPCGPLQTMQLYALGTGSAPAGAFSMFLFSIGTVPLMLIFGLTAALLPRKFIPHMVKAGAVLVMFLGIVTMGRAAALTGVSFPSVSALSSVLPIPWQYSSTTPSSGRATVASNPVATIANEIQTITTEFKDGYYVPFTVQAGIPLKWVIRVTEEDLNGCNNPVEVPEYRVRKILVPGDNVIEFIPAKKGKLNYSCWMGMITSKITVVKDIGEHMQLAQKGDAIWKPRRN